MRYISLLYRLQILPVVILFALSFMSCTNQQGKADHETYSGALEELGVTFDLAKDWVEGEPSRHTEASMYQGLLDQTPENVRYIYDDYKPDNPNRLVGGSNYYRYTNVTEETLEDFVSGRKEHVFDYGLLIDFNSDKSPEALQLWKDGKCRNPQQTDTPRLCQKSTENHRLIRRLDATEIPFNADSGFLYESDMEYGYPEKKKAKQLIYYFYVVKGDKSYRIRIRGVETDPMKAGLIEENALLNEKSIADMLSSIRFI